MPQAHADPEEIKKFARMLKVFNQDLTNNTNVLQGQFQNLEETWKDRQFQEFAQEFEQMISVLHQFVQSSEQQIPLLHKNAEWLDKYLSIQSGTYTVQTSSYPGSNAVNQQSVFSDWADNVVSRLFDEPMEMDSDAAWSDEEIIAAYTVLEIAGLELTKIRDGTYSHNGLLRLVKGALGEYVFYRDNESQGPFAAWLEYGTVHLKPERYLDEQHRGELFYTREDGTIVDMRPDAIVFSTAGNDRGRISHVIDVKAWSECSLEQSWSFENLKKRAMKYAGLRELSPQGRIIFALPNDVLKSQRQRIDVEVAHWDIGTQVEFIPLSSTNQELFYIARKVIKIVRKAI
jgi:uncharacterized protein YukE